MKTVKGHAAIKKKWRKQSLASKMYFSDACTIVCTNEMDCLRCQRASGEQTSTMLCVR